MMRISPLLLLLALFITLSFKVSANFCVGNLYYRRLGSTDLFVQNILAPGVTYSGANGVLVPMLTGCDSGVYAGTDAVCCLVSGVLAKLHCLNLTTQANQTFELAPSPSTTVEIDSQLRMDFVGRWICIQPTTTSIRCMQWNGSLSSLSTLGSIANWQEYVSGGTFSLVWTLSETGTAANPETVLHVGLPGGPSFYRYRLESKSGQLPMSSISSSLLYGGLNMMAPYGNDLLIHNSSLIFGRVMKLDDASMAISAMSGYVPGLAFMVPTTRLNNNATCIISATSDAPSRLGFISPAAPNFVSPYSPGFFFRDDYELGSFSFRSTEALPMAPVPGSSIPNSVSCPEPQPRPTALFRCDTTTGIWVSPSDVSEEKIEVTQPVVIEGDFVVLDTLTFTGLSAFANVTGCATIKGIIYVELTPEELDLIVKSADGRKSLIVSGCDTSSLATVPISVKLNTPKCQKITATAVSADTGLSAIFTIDKSSCNRWWIILVSVLAVIAALIIALALLFTFSKSARTWIRPFSTRDKRSAA